MKILSWSNRSKNWNRLKKNVEEKRTIFDEKRSAVDSLRQQQMHIAAQPFRCRKKCSSGRYFYSEPAKALLPKLKKNKGNGRKLANLETEIDPNEKELKKRRTTWSN